MMGNCLSLFSFIYLHRDYQLVSILVIAHNCVRGYIVKKGFIITIAFAAMFILMTLQGGTIYGGQHENMIVQSHDVVLDVNVDPTVRL